MKNPKISVIIIYSDNQNTVKNFIKSLETQRFTDYEAVFVNCCSNESVINMVSENVAGNENWNIITLPDNKDSEKAKQTALNVVSGEFVCFVNDKDNIQPDFFENIYQNYYKNEISSLNPENNKLYKRSYVENNSEIRDIINIQVENETKTFSEEFNNFEKSIEKKLDACYRNSDELINNKVFNINERMKFLENFIQEKENALTSNVNEAIKTVTEIQIKSESNNNSQKTYEQEEIFAKLRQIEQDFDKKIQEQNSKLTMLEQKFENYCQEQEGKYNYLLQLLDKLLKVVFGDGNNEKFEMSYMLLLEKNIKKDFDAVYSYINENNKRFYQELMSLYKETDEKIRKK